MISGYIETSVIIGWANRQKIRAEDHAALDKLARRWEAGQLELWTSERARDELGKHALGWSASERRIYELLNEIPLAEEALRLPQLLTNQHSKIYGPTVVNDEVFGRILALVPDYEDAQHIFQAAQAGIDYFITCDYKSILDHHTELIEETVKIKPRSPSQLVAELDAIAKS